MSGQTEGAAQPQSFAEITGRLDEIVKQVRDKNVSLEKSLDLFDEAIALGSKAIDMVDTEPATQEEKAAQPGDTPSGDDTPAGGEAADAQERR